LRNLSSQLSVSWAFHAPGDDISLFTTYPPVRRGIIEYLKDIVDFARDVSESETSVVVHSGVTPRFRKAGERDDAFGIEYHDSYLESFCRAMRELVRYGEPKVRIALENHLWTPLVREAIDLLTPDGLALCLDIPKLYDDSLSLKSEDWSVFSSHKDSIEVVHLHDFSRELGGHQVVGKGSIDFNPALRLLSELSRPPLCVFEVRPRDAAAESLQAFGRILRSMELRL
jgi:sugar phosphate isomerase/epimerase